MGHGEGSFQPVWDLPLRLFHWTLAGLLLLMFATALLFEHGLAVHTYGGMALGVMLLWRLLWGVAGGDTARFSGFVRRPRAAVAYLRAWLGGRPPHYVGHNPAGGLMVVTMLAVLLVQVLSGSLLSLAEQDAVRLPRYTKTWLAIGHALNGWFIGLLAFVHATTILAYALRGIDLVSPMVRGFRPLGPDEKPVPVRVGTTGRAAALLAGSALFVGLLYALA